MKLGKRLDNYEKKRMKGEATGTKLAFIIFYASYMIASLTLFPLLDGTDSFYSGGSDLSDTTLTAPSDPLTAILTSLNNIFNLLVDFVNYQVTIPFIGIFTTILTIGAVWVLFEMVRGN